jgi:short-subunit dehydrogenase
VRELLGKKTLITGAASGIGRALALRMAREGANLYLLDRNEAGLTEVVSAARRIGVDAFARCCDLTQEQDVTRSIAQILKHWNHLDVLVNNAGVAFYGLTDEMTEEQWEQVLGVNLMAPVQFTREFLPVLLRRPEAHILNVASMYGYFVTNRCSAYHLSKFAILGFSEALRAEYGKTGLGVTALCPGFVTTNLYSSMMYDRSQREKRLPPRWMCTTPEQVATKAVRGIYRNQRIVLVTPLAHVMYHVRRLAPGLIDRLYRIGRRRIPVTDTRLDEPTLRVFPADQQNDPYRDAA